MIKHGATAYLVNTGWIGGSYGIGNRIDLQSTRNIITAILNGSLDEAEYEELPTFGLNIPLEVEGVDSHILNPRNTWKYETAYVKQAQMLAEKFIENFEHFTDTEEGKRLVAAGPKDRHMKQFYNYYEKKILQLEDEHKQEISRLKDQIYILQNSFTEYISFNSISSEYKQRKLNRHVPVFSFFNTENDIEIKKIHKSILSLLDKSGFIFYNNEKEAEKYNKRMADFNTSSDISNNSSDPSLLNAL